VWLQWTSDSSYRISPRLRLRFASANIERSRFPKGHAKRPQQLPSLVVAVRGRHERHVHSLSKRDLIRIDLREHQLLGQAQTVIAMPVKALRIDAAKVTDTRQGNADEPIEEFIHPPAAQGDLAA